MYRVEYTPTRRKPTMRLTIKRDRDYPIFWIVDASTKEKTAGPFATREDAAQFIAKPYTPAPRETDSRMDPGYLYDLTH